MAPVIESSRLPNVILILYGTQRAVIYFSLAAGFVRRGERGVGADRRAAEMIR
jgi:hypothetical protein